MGNLNFDFLKKAGWAMLVILSIPIILFNPSAFAGFMFAAFVVLLVIKFAKWQKHHITPTEEERQMRAEYNRVVPTTPKKQKRTKPRYIPKIETANLSQREKMQWDEIVNRIDD